MAAAGNGSGLRQTDRGPPVGRAGRVEREQQMRMTQPSMGVKVVLVYVVGILVVLAIMWLAVAIIRD